MRPYMFLRHQYERGFCGLNGGYGWGTTTNVTTVSAPLVDGIAFEANVLDPARQLAGTGLVPGITGLANSGVASVNQNGFIGGRQIGYNYQTGSNLIVGLEADFQGAAIPPRAAQCFLAAVLKTAVGESLPWVRIPPLPPVSADFRWF